MCTPVISYDLDVPDIIGDDMVIDIYIYIHTYIYILLTSGTALPITAQDHPTPSLFFAKIG
jgi:hypothetical protein